MISLVKGSTVIKRCLGKKDIKCTEKMYSIYSVGRHSQTYCGHRFISLSRRFYTLDSMITF